MDQSNRNSKQKLLIDQNIIKRLKINSFELVFSLSESICLFFFQLAVYLWAKCFVDNINIYRIDYIYIFNAFFQRVFISFSLILKDLLVWSGLKSAFSRLKLALLDLRRLKSALSNLKSVLRRLRNAFCQPSQKTDWLTKQPLELNVSRKLKIA